MLRIEQTILKNLFRNDEFIQKCFPYLQEEYFVEKDERTLFQHIKQYIEQYSSKPTIEAILIQLDQNKNVNEQLQQEVIELVETIYNDTEESNFEWLFDNTEKFCKDRAIYIAINKAIQIADGSDKLTTDAIPELLQDALGVSFCTDVGMDYFEDSNERYEQYHTKTDKIKFRLDSFNYVTNGGLTKPSLTAFLSPSGLGKSMFMCSLAADYVSCGYNVVYITLEMSERKIAERIDANLLDIDISNLFNINRGDFNSKIEHLKNKTRGRLIIKEYPTSSAHAGNFKQLIREIKNKKGMDIDVIIVDYLGITASSKMKLGNSINSYNLLKSVAEELRALCQEENAICLTGVQANRSGYNNSDVDLTSIADSLGIIFALDLFFAITVDEQMEEDGEALLTQLKNRYSSTAYKRFRIKMDRSRMRLDDHVDTMAKIREFKEKYKLIRNELKEENIDKETGEITFGSKSKVKSDFTSLSFDD